MHTQGIVLADRYRGKWHVVYEGGTSVGMKLSVAKGYLNIFKSALYIERTFCVWRFEFRLRFYK